ncbi:MAG: hypothetical protein DRI57_31325 [Deltaproteobacteria bacterium]|nr:MAG: hypothetical protein DRI57_31325 [Deltaproteobacteria bacterium]
MAAKSGEQPTDSTDAAPGDIDGSGGAIDLKDAILALKVCAGLSPSGIRKEADINNDTRIGVEEAVYIFRNLATPIR